MGADPAVTIVLIAYYGAEYLDALYASLRALTYPRERYRLLVVENGPERRARAWFAEHAPDVRVIVPGENIGYAGGAALGMELAIAEGADYVVILTQDTRVDPDWLRELVDTAERHPDAGAVQPKILRAGDAGQAVIHTWGNELHFLGVGYVGGDGQPDRALDVREVPYASGAGVLYRTASLQRVGLADPAYFMYHEDSDLSWRMRLAGERVLLAPRAIMYHDYEFSRSTDKFYYIERNRLINVLTHYRLRTLALIAPALCLFEAFVLLFALGTGWLRKRFAVYAFFLRRGTWLYLRDKRRQVQALRRVPDRAIAAHLTGRIDFPGLESRVLRGVLSPLAAYWRLIRPLIRW